MLHKNFAHFIGQPIDFVKDEIELRFFGQVVVYTPGQQPDESVKPSRLKVFVDDQGLITKIVNG